MPTPSTYVSRGGLKLAAALNHFRVDPAGLACADLGCSTGGFTDCLLQGHAAHVFSVDTAYGQLAWTLRQHPRVSVLERTNALHHTPDPTHPHFPHFPCDLVVIDLGWTRQHLAIPAALRWLKPHPDARIISLVKPHYEQEERSPRRRRHVLADEEAHAVVDRVLDDLPPLGVRVLNRCPSPIRGSKGGNPESLILLAPTP